MTSLNRRRRSAKPLPRRWKAGVAIVRVLVVPLVVFALGTMHPPALLPLVVVSSFSLPIQQTHEVVKPRRGVVCPIRAFGSAKLMMQQQQSSSTTTTTAGASGGVVSVDPDTKQIKFMHLTKDQDDELKRLGDREERLMKNVVPLVPTDITTSSRSSSIPSKKSKKRPRTGGAGFGGGGGGTTARSREEKAENPSNVGTEVSVLADVLARDGLVCIENVLPDDVANQLRNYLIDLRDRSRAAIESGIITNSQDRFADVLLNQNRCDLKVPLGPAPVNDALRHLLSSDRTVLRDLIQVVYNRHGSVGSQSTLYELNCFMSQSGARRQLVHADIACQNDDDRPSILAPDEPIMLTCFVALQDVDETMGPTCFIPGTHNLQAHEQFFETNKDGERSGSSSASTKDRLLGSRQAVRGTLKTGSCILFDPRTLHCAGANVCSDPDKTRALFYFSFKNPKVDSPGCPSCGGYGIPTAEFTLERLCDELEAEQYGGGELGAAAYRKLAMIASNP